MSCYFDDLSLEQLGKDVRFSMLDKFEKEEVYKEVALLREAIEVIEGGRTFNSEIFFHESNIYMDVLHSLLKNGYFVWEVYDEWHAKKKGIAQQQYEMYVSNLVAIKANKYIDELLKQQKESNLNE